MENILHINRFQTKEEAAASAGEALNRLLIKFTNQPTLLLLSGGSAFAILNYISASSLGDNLTVTMLDDRASQDAMINNFLQLQQTEFYENALAANCSFFGTLPRVGETKENLAARRQSNLKKWRKENPHGKIVATIGMGADGHTAGIFPFPKDETRFNQLFNAANWVVAYDTLGGNPYPERVTATFTFFQEIDEAIGYICGKEKKSQFKALVTKNGQIHELPVLGIYKIKHAQIFTDIN